MSTWNKIALPRDREAVSLQSWGKPRLLPPLLTEPYREGHAAGLAAKVIQSSPRSLKNATEKFARYFKREFRYDFIQYVASEYMDPSSVAFLWSGENGVGWKDFTGAVLFSRCEYTNIPARYEMSWVWVHPYFRRSGYLSRAWPYFRKEFGDFWVGTPWSPAMKEFLKKQPEFMARFNPTGKP